MPNVVHELPEEKVSCGEIMLEKDEGLSFSHIIIRLWRDYVTLTRGPGFYVVFIKASVVREVLPNGEIVDHTTDQGEITHYLPYESQTVQEDITNIINTATADGYRVDGSPTLDVAASMRWRQGVYG